MIRFEPVEKPAGFVEKVEEPGAAWLGAHPSGRPKDLWSPFKPQLAEAFRDLCAYSAMFEPVGTVDHFLSCDELPIRLGMDQLEQEQFALFNDLRPLRGGRWLV